MASENTSESPAKNRGQRALSLEPGFVEADGQSAQIAIPEPGGMGSIDIMTDVSLGASLDAVAGAIPAAGIGMEEPWKKKGHLARNTPDPRPGFVQRWVRIYDVEGRPDASNVGDALQEGWRPRAGDTVPAGVHVATAQDQRYGTVIATKGMVLMERAVELENAYAAQIKRETDRRTAIVYQDAESAIPERYGAIRHNSRSKTTVGERDAASLVDD
jgi:hypothetical protein